MAAFQAAYVSSILTICSICRITQEADEGDLLSRYTSNSIEGSNPSFDAKWVILLPNRLISYLGD